MIRLKTPEEIELLRESSLLVGKTLAEVAKMIKPGLRTLDLDRMAETFIRDNGAIPGFKGYNGFPFTLCISINEEVVHGFPGERKLNEGDIVSVDCGVIKNGYYGDYAYTFAVGKIKEEVKLLMKRTQESLDKGIEMARAGNRLGDIGYAIQSHVEKYGYSVVRELVGHGIGKQLHEKPEVMNYGRKGDGMKLKAGLVICIEPMINLGKRYVLQSRDGWTIRTADGQPSAHYEHMVAIRERGPDVLSTYKYIEEVLNLQSN